MLFLRECKKILLSTTFVALLVGALAMTGSQGVLDFTDSVLEMPQPGQDSYGTQTKDVPEIIMPAALASLYGEFTANRYTAYPIGFYKNVKLNEKRQPEMAEILSQLTDVPADEFMEMAGAEPRKENRLTIGKDGEIMAEGGGNALTIEDILSQNEAVSPISLKDNLSYEAFKKYMRKADDLIGGGSHYSDTALVRFGKVPVTYEEAMESYTLFVERDQVTGAYARLFSDYLVHVLSILPVFVTVALCLRDRRTRMDALIYTRRASSFKIIWTRYLAALAVITVPAVLLSYISNMSIWRFYSGAALDYLAPLKYTLGWLLPSIMVSAAVGMFFTELTGTPIAVAVQGLWWFVDINLGVSELSGGYSISRLAPRHNTLRNTQVYLEHFDRLAANRFLFAAIALILVAATVVVYEMKRRGRFHGFGKIPFTVLANRKGKPAA